MQTSARKIARTAVVMGSCTAGSTYVPAISDQTVIVRGQGPIFLARLTLRKQATGEKVDAGTPDGGDTHTRLSGVADVLAENDDHALALTRRILRNLGPGRKVLPDYRDPFRRVWILTVCFRSFRGTPKPRST